MVGCRWLRQSAAALAIFALLLQASALLLHHTIAPHVHSLAADIAAADMPFEASDGHSHHHHHPSSPDKAPAQHLPACPVWTALHLLGGCTAPVDAPLLLVAWVMVAALVAACTPLVLRWSVSAGQPRAPPLLG
jgi:hypothetical protein